MKRPLLSMYSGCGGLDLGLEEAGFRVALCVEKDPDCLRTLRDPENSRFRHWRIADPADALTLDPQDALRQARLAKGDATLLAAGPPCQPYSKAGYWANGDSERLRDPRARTLDALLDMVAVALPEVVLIENVDGLRYKGKDEALHYLTDRLLHINRAEGTDYNPVVISLNAADYGVPQSRRRVFVIAHRGGRRLEAPSPTHAAHVRAPGSNGMQPVATAWDALGDLDELACPGELRARGYWAGVLPSVPEGENYLALCARDDTEGLWGWRTRYWSFLLKLAPDLPSWTLQASPGPSTGPFHWRNRRLSVRELCRLQTIPDDVQISGSYLSAVRQIGNAVPSALGELLGLEIRRQLLGEQTRRRLRLIPGTRSDCPPRTPPTEIPPQYRKHLGHHPRHGGTGQGPRAQAQGRG